MLFDVVLPAMIGGALGFWGMFVVANIIVRLWPGKKNRRRRRCVKTV